MRKNLKTGWPLAQRLAFFQDVRDLKARRQQEQVREAQASEAIAAFLEAGKKNEEIV